MSTAFTAFKSIQSPHNKDYRRWVSLHGSAGVKKQGQCLISGSKLVPEILQQFPELCLEWITSLPQPIKLSSPTTLPPHLQQYSLPPALFKKLDLFGTHSPLLIARTPPIQTFSKERPLKGLEVLCGLGDPGNLGALARCCEAFQVQHLVLLTSSAHPFHPKVIRSSSGSIFRLSLEQGPPIEEIDFSIIALDPKATQSVGQFSWPLQARLLMGEEGPGLPKQLRAQRISIPMSPLMESLNTVSAASIALYSYRRFHNKV